MRKIATRNEIIIGLLLALGVLVGTAYAAIPSFRAASVRLTGAASAGTTGTAANPTLWADTTTRPNLRLGDGTADQYIPACTPTTNGDVCSWNGTNWVRAAGGGGGTMATTYAAGASQTDSTILLDSTRLGVRIQQDAGAVVTAPFSIWNNALTTAYVNFTTNANHLLKSGAADGASAVAVAVDTSSAWSNATAKILRLLTGGSEKFAVLASGKLSINGAIDTNAAAAMTLGGNANATTITVQGSTSAALKSPTAAGTVQADDSAGVTMSYNSSSVVGNSSSVTMTGGVADGSTAVAMVDQTQNLFSTAGATIHMIKSGSTGVLRLGVASGVSGTLTEFAEELSCPGTCSAGQVLVWTGTNQVAAAAATANLTTIAGVAITGGTNATIIVARRGRVIVNCEAGVTVGQLVGTSGSTAGRVTNGTPGAGAIVGRATDAVNGNAEGANKITIDLILG